MKLRTAAARATSLLAYARWLENTGTDWRYFPPRKDERCLVRYRGFLVSQRDDGTLAASTATQRMRTVVHFYRWMNAAGLISADWPMWREKSVGIRLPDRFGFDRLISSRTTDLAIPNRVRRGDRLEDGVVPVTQRDRDRILTFARSNASEETFLMLAIGFFTGMRLQTISDLKVGSLDCALPDGSSEDLYRIEVGPTAIPPVATKFDVSGSIFIPKNLLDHLKQYSESTRRLKREARAANGLKDLLFLTRFGNAYAARGTDKSSALNVEMHALRKRGKRQGIDALSNFRFHQTRATFATELARASIRAGGAIQALQIVREALLHKSEATSLKYIRFIEKVETKKKVADEFTRAFLGLDL
ncbi:tyrosine-type recombinase/integrase [Lysobacter soli]|uniref:tyrosine-type recombinase/integrase n=1 Tax=Lysobacter soli TaxID=453783 RepID=UPI00240F9CBB|nr:site-specific integrase [Lysobacter soli]MDG2517812.1 site-specific integrase [Lysobacter soli]